MPMYKKSLLILLILVLAAAGGTMYGLYDQNQAQTLDQAEKDAQATPEATITVYVTGAVNKPGVVTVAEGARAADAINACGGVLPNADHENINMAQVLKDGQQLRVPEKNNGSSQAGAAGNNGTGKTGLVNINTADEKALDALPGIGPAMAKHIIEYRETEGQFQTIEDLKKVKGIGDAKFNKMKDKLCV